MPDARDSGTTGNPQRYPLLAQALEDGTAGIGQGLPDPAKRKPRCGPWDLREDGIHVCRKCGRLDPLDFTEFAS